MSNQNGKTVSTVDLLQAELREHRGALLKSRAEFQTSQNQLAILNRILATYLHRLGEARIVLTQEEAQAAFDATWHRLDLDFVDQEGGTAIACSLVPVTDAERKKAEKDRAKADKKAAKKGPKLLNADGQELDG